MRYLLAYTAVAFIICGCQILPHFQSDARVISSKPSAQHARPPRPVIAGTIVPETFNRMIATSAEQKPRAIPKSMVALAEVTRPRAEVREGPGGEFRLQDDLLTQGTRILVFSRIGVWLKVLVPESGQKGWVHRQAVSAARPSEHTVNLDMNRLPTVLAVREIELAKTFPAQTDIRVHIPKGAIFRSLMENEWGTLVWLAETNSVMWMARKDVQ